MSVNGRVLEISLLAVFVTSLLAANSAFAAASTYTYYLNGPIVRANSNSLQGAPLSTAPGTNFTNFQEIGDTVFFNGSSTASYQTDNTTNTTVQVWLCTDINEAGPSWGDFNFTWSITDNSTNYPTGIIVASSNFTANLTADWTLVPDSAPTTSTFINATDTLQLSIQCTSTSINQVTSPNTGWWLSSNSSQDNNLSSFNIPAIQQSAVPEMPLGTIAASMAMITVLAVYISSQKLKKHKTIPNAR
jgi:hypothetical protein